MLCTDLSRAVSPLRASSLCYTSMQGAASRAHSAPKYSNRVFNTANSSWELQFRETAHPSAGLSWQTKGQLQFLEQSMFTQVQGEQRKTCTEHLQEESRGGSGEALPAPRDEYSDSFLHILVTSSLERPKEGYVMVVWAAPSFSMWFSTKMSPKVNTPTMCVLKDSKKRKK